MWGPVWWKVLKCVLYDVQYNQALNTKYLCRFWSLLPRVLPCSMCSVNCQEKVLAELTSGCNGNHKFCRKPFCVIVEFHKKVIENKGGAFPTSSVSPVCATWAQVQSGAIRYDKFDLAMFGFYVANCRDIEEGFEFLTILNSFLPKHQQADIQRADREHLAMCFARNCENYEDVARHLFERIPRVYNEYKNEMRKRQ